jgi:hypothetical protein
MFFFSIWADHKFSVMFFWFNLSRSQFLSDVFLIWAEYNFSVMLPSQFGGTSLDVATLACFFSLSRVQFFFSFNKFSLILFIQICWVQIVICWSWEHRHWLLLYLVGCLHALGVDSFILVSHMVQCFKGTLRGRQILDLSMNLMISNMWSCLECLDTFFELCGLFRSRHLLRDSIHSFVEEQVVMFLHVGHNQRFRVLKFTFRRSTETLVDIFTRC